MPVPEVFEDFWNDFLSSRYSSGNGKYTPNKNVDGAIIKDDVWLQESEIDWKEGQFDEFGNELDEEIIKEIALEGKQFIALDSKQIKLADGTNTTFDPSKPSIRFSISDDVGKYIKQARAQGMSEGAIKVVLNRRGVEMDVIQDAFKKTKKKAAVRTEVSEKFVKGYDRVMKELDGVIAKVKKRNVNESTSPNKIYNAGLKYIKGTKVYEKATDVQREMMVRDLRKKIGLKEKKAPSVKKILFGVQDVKKITITETQAIANRLADIREGADGAKSALMKASKNLSEEISDMESKGKITTKQMNDILRKFSRVDMDNLSSIDRFVDYMSKVMSNAEYANQIAEANNGRRRAFKNAGSKVGIADGLVPQLQRLFSVNPTLIPSSVFDTYLNLISTFKSKDKVLSLEDIQVATKKTEEVLKQLDEELSMTIDLADRFENYKDKVKDDDGKVDYAATIKQMLKEENITEEEAVVMRKYKKEIVPSVEKVKKSEAEIKKEKDTLIKQVKKSSINLDEENNLPSREERDAANELKKLIKTDGVSKLSINDLKNLLKLIDNINNGYLPHFAEIMIEKINAMNDSALSTSAIKEGKLLPFTKIYSRIKSLVTRSKRGSIAEMIRRNPLFNIDELFGDFKTQRIFKSIFGRAAEALSQYTFDFKRVQSLTDKAQQAVFKSLGRDGNLFVESSFKQMAYMIQEEFLSNPNNKEVNSVVDFIKATIEAIDTGKTQYSDTDANILEKILDEYTDDNGRFDNEALFESFNKAEKKSIETLRDINDGLTTKAVFTSNIIRGEGIKPINNYVHLNVMRETGPNDVSSSASDIQNYNERLKPSTRGKNLIARTGKVSPLNFDVYASVQKGAKFTLMDFYLTKPIRTARRTLNQTEKQLRGDNNRIPKKQREIFNAINSAFEETVDNLLVNAYTESSLADEIALYLKKTGYRSVLAGTGRFAAELTSNLSFALIADPKGFIEGSKLTEIMGSPSALEIMMNLGAKQLNRIFPEDNLSGKLVDPNNLNEATGVKGVKSKGTVSNFLNKMHSKTTGRWIKGVEFVADGLISTPDKLIMRPMWFGAFSNRFEAITGVKPNFDKIAANDEAYMEKYESALKESTDLADRRSVLAGSTNNAFMGMLKGVSRPNQSLSVKAFNTFNNYMSSFLIQEFVTARRGVMSMMGRSELSRKQGAALLGAVTSRMMIYTLLSQLTAEAMTSLFSDDDDDEMEFKLASSILEEDEPEFKSLGKRLGQSFASSFTSLLFGRDFGNATKTVVNFFVEEFNKEYLEALRDGEYDKFKDAIQYNIVPESRQGRGSNLSDFLQKMLGPFAPAYGTADLLVEKLTEDKKKTPEAIERQDMERYVRLPLELFGNLGLVPLYKDIRKVVLSNIYADLSRAQKDLENKKKTKEEMLQGFDSESDMKRYDRQLWEQTFGPNSPGYDERQAEKELKKAAQKIKQQMKDELYDYTPTEKRKTTKESTMFGPSKKKTSGFGPSKKESTMFGPSKKKSTIFGPNK